MTTAAKTRADVSAWSRRYQLALRRYLKTESATALRVAQRLGRQAVAFGMETLDVAHIHEQALAALAAAGGMSRVAPADTNRATSFFEAVIVPIEQTHGPARQADAQVTKLTRALRQRTQEATASSRQLQKGVAQRKAAEAALAKSVQSRAALVAEAERLRLHLQHLTREIILAQEEDQKATGGHLRDDVAQLLLAIQLRLLALNGAVMANSENLQKEIAETQRIVRESVSTIHQLTPVVQGRHAM